MESLVRYNIKYGEIIINQIIFIKPHSTEYSEILSVYMDRIFPEFYFTPGVLLLLIDNAIHPGP